MKIIVFFKESNFEGFIHIYIEYKECRKKQKEVEQSKIKMQG